MSECQNVTVGGGGVWASGTTYSFLRIKGMYHCAVKCKPPVIPIYKLLSLRLTRIFPEKMA